MMVNRLARSPLFMAAVRMNILEGAGSMAGLELSPWDSGMAGG